MHCRLRLNACDLHRQKIIPFSDSERFNGGAAGTGGIAIGHDVDGYIGLLFALHGHASTDFADEPLLELWLRFESAAADSESVRIEDVNHLIEEEAKRARLDTKNFHAERVATLSKTSDEFGCLMRSSGTIELMAAILCKEVRQKRSFDCRERTKRFDVAW